MKHLKKQLLVVMQTKYRSALEVIMSHEVEGEFGSQKKVVEDRTRRYREAIDQIEQIGKEMDYVIKALPT